jgi:hypothetical protein
MRCLRILVQRMRRSFERLRRLLRVHVAPVQHLLCRSARCSDHAVSNACARGAGAAELRALLPPPMLPLTAPQWRHGLSHALCCCLLLRVLDAPAAHALLPEVWLFACKRERSAASPPPSTVGARGGVRGGSGSGGAGGAAEAAAAAGRPVGAVAAAERHLQQQRLQNPQVCVRQFTVLTLRPLRSPSAFSICCWRPVSTRTDL